MTITDRLENAGFMEDEYNGAVIIDGFDSACIGYSDDGHLIYSYTLMLEQLVIDDGCTLEEAADYLGYNVLGSYLGTGMRHPIIVYDI